MKKKRCVECNEVTSLVHGDREYEGLPGVILHNVKIDLCPQGHESITLPNPGSLVQNVAREILHKHSLLFGGEFLVLRNSVGLFEIEKCADIVGFPQEVIGEWEENDSPVHPYADRKLRLFGAPQFSERVRKRNMSFADTEPPRPLHVGMLFTGDEWTPVSF